MYTLQNNKLWSFIVQSTLGLFSYFPNHIFAQILLLWIVVVRVKLKFGRNLMQKQILHWFSPNCKQLIKFSKEVGNIFLLIRAWAMMMLIFPYIMYLLQFLNEFPVLYLSTSPKKSLFQFNSIRFFSFFKVPRKICNRKILNLFLNLLYILMLVDINYLSFGPIRK